jgi:Protein of unknown function (DUF3987)/Bifunctional DNA primase/polymerase, N-terminal
LRPQGDAPLSLAGLMATTLESARAYTRAGWSVVPVPHRRKGPVLQGWQNIRLAEADLPRYFNGHKQNIGVLNGSPSGGLIDTDLDADEAVKAATRLMPPTGRIGGRESRPGSHRFYLVEMPPEDASEPFDDPCRPKGADGWRFLEIRSTGGQTIVPPSIHPDGDAYRWDDDGRPAKMSFTELRRAAALTATAALMTRYWPDPGQQHDASLHWAGYLLNHHVPLPQVELLIDTAANLAHDPKAPTRARDARTTAERVQNGESVTGGPSLIELLGEDVGPKILERVAKWLGFVGFGSPSGAHSEPNWPDRGTVPQAPPVPTLPAEMVPLPLRPWLVDAAARLCIPLEMVAVPAIVLVSGIVGRTLAIRPTKYDDFTVVPNVWGADVARPGWLKSPAMNQVLAPVHFLVSRAQAQYETARAAAEAEADRLEAEISAVKAEMTKAAKAHEDLSELKVTLADLKREHRDCEAHERRYMTQDSTMEKLGEILKENPRGLALVRDELAGWLCTLERPGREGEREFYLEAWAGDHSFTVDRIGRGTIHIPALTLSIVGGIQPGKLRRYVDEAQIEGSGADGLLQRFQLLVWPDSLGDWHRVDRWPDTRAKQEAFGIFEWLDALDPRQTGAEIDTDDAEQLALDTEAEVSRDWRKLPYLRFERDAQGLFDTWRDELEHRLRSDQLAPYPAFESHLSKYRSLMPSLALLFHLIDVAGGAKAGPVTLASARLAAAWCEFLEAHARKVYVVELNPGPDGAAALAVKIEQGRVVDGQTVREIYRNQWSGLATVERVQAALVVLEVAHWVRLTTVETEGRPSEVVRLHPDFRRRGHG